MDGFYTNAGIWAMGYYTAEELPFYYSLFDEFTLCANFFCSLLGPTWPNRFYLAAGTSGGITTNGLWGYGIFDYPIILDLLDAAGRHVEGLQHRLGQRAVREHRQRLRLLGAVRARPADAREQGLVPERPAPRRLPQVSFIIPSYARGWDEHPPADVSVGMGIQEELITALRESSAWDSSRTSSRTTSTAGTSITCAARRSTRSARACGSPRG